MPTHPYLYAALLVGLLAALVALYRYHNHPVRRLLRELTDEEERRQNGGLTDSQVW